MRNVLAAIAGALVATVVIVAASVQAQVGSPGGNYGVQEFVHNGSAFTQSGDITLSGDVQIDNSGQAVEIGAGCTTSHSLTSGDTQVCGALEVEGVAYLDGSVTVTGVLTTAGTISSTLGLHLFQQPILGFSSSSNDYTLLAGNLGTDQFILGTGAQFGNQFILGPRAHYANDFDHAVQTNPTLFIHSETNPDTDNTQWGSLYHDQTDFRLDVGSGSLVVTGDSLGIPVISDAAPAEPFACAAGTFGRRVYVNDTNDGAVPSECVCGQQADDSTYDWLKNDSSGTACPFF